MTTKAGKSLIHSVYLEGPYISYQPAKPVKQPGALQTLTVMQNGTQVATRQVSFDFAPYDGSLTVNAVQDQSTSAGVYDLFALAQVSGPVFNISVENPSDFDNIQLTPRMLKDTDYQPQVMGAMNIPEPSFWIKHRGRYAVGFGNNAVTTLIYYYHNYDQFWYMEDTGFLCKAVDAEIQGEDFILAAMACNEGGEFHLRAFMKSINGGSGSSFIAHNIEASQITISRINSLTFAVAAVDIKTGIARTYVIPVQTDGNGNYWLDESQTMVGSQMTQGKLKANFA
jgi:hypothetical protein